MGIETRAAHADTAADALQSEGYKASTWCSDDCDDDAKVRIYVERTLSRGRQQRMGYVAIELDGTVNARGMDRAAATVRDIVTAATGLQS